MLTTDDSERILQPALAGPVFASVMAMLAPALVAAQAQPGENTLTAAEKATGWRLLFDGTSAAGGRGHIAIQDHGDKVSFRNIKIRTP